MRDAEWAERAVRDLLVRALLAVAAECERAAFAMRSW
jgi:hypothetical protein